jgi:hypothetical protein
MYDAFISYSRQDLVAIDQLKHHSAPLHLNLFLDSARLKPGDPWPAQLGDSIKNARLLILCWSASSAVSDWVQAELKFALLAKKPILPWRLDPTPLPNHVTTIQAVSTATTAADFIAHRRTAHRRRTSLTTAAAAAIILPAAWLATQRLTTQTTSFHGAILDEQNHPIPGVTIEADRQRTTTLPNGEFSLTLPVPPNNRQALKVHIYKPGYQPQFVDTQTDVPLSRILEKAN